MWDAAKWDGGLKAASDAVRGGSGMGRAVAIAIKGRTSANVTLIGFDISFDGGGFL